MLIDSDKKFIAISRGNVEHDKQPHTWEEWKTDFFQSLNTDSKVTNRQIRWFRSLKDKDLFEEIENRFECELKETF